MKIRGFITHKIAETYTDCADFFAVNSSKKSVAISDGITRSFLPQYWSEELVTAWNENDWQPNNTDESLSPLREIWLHRAHALLESKKTNGENTYRFENSLATKESGGATLCAVKFTGNQWEGFVLGDSCLIIVNADNKIADIFRSNEGDFDNYPDYFDSIQGGRGNVKSISGELQPQCKLLFVTDPFADFLYEKHKNHQESTFIQQLLDIQSHKSFVSLIDRWREDEGMHNDDSTLVVVEDDGELIFNLQHLDDLKQLRLQEQEEQAKHQPTTEGPKVQESCEQKNEALPTSNGHPPRKTTTIDGKMLLSLCQELREVVQEFYSQKDGFFKKLWKEFRNKDYSSYKEKEDKMESLINRLDSIIKKIQPPQ